MWSTQQRRVSCAIHGLDGVVGTECVEPLPDPREHVLEDVLGVRVRAGRTPRVAIAST